ncbi:MAG: protein-disulfide reductase DsbD domain-containing protein [candidate division Zixibacteria bacterium]
MKSEELESHNIRFSILYILAALLLSGNSVQAKPVQAEHVEAELISENRSIVPGEPFWVALKLRMDNDWHINWSNPGDFGLAPTIAWQLPEGFKAGEIEWPVPERLIFSPFVGYGYEGEKILPVKISPPNSVMPGTEIKLEAAADWIVCGEVCIPGGAKLSLELNVIKSSPLPDINWAQLFESFREAAPQVDSSYRVSSKLTEKALFISVDENSSNKMQIDSLIFFPKFKGLIKNAASQKLSKDESGYVLEIERDPLGVTPPERLKGILVLRKNNGLKTIKTSFKFDVLLRKN